MGTLELLPTPQTQGLKKCDKQGKTRFFSLQVAFPASHSPKPDAEKERQMTAISGRKCVASYQSFPHVTSWQRMFADCLVSTGDWYSSRCALTWKLSATKSNRLLFQLVPSTLPIEETGYGLLPTPRANKHTPQSRADFSPNLAYRIAMLPTPRAHDGDKGVRTEEGYRKEKERWGRKNGEDLPTRIAMANGMRTGLKLQPDFALWMMGYPTDWCDLVDGEMPHSKRQATPSFRK